MPLIAGVFFLISAGVAYLGFSTVRSDIQIIIGVLGLLFSGVFLTLFSHGLSQWSLTGAAKRIENAIGDVEDTLLAAKPIMRKDAASDFNAAVLLYQQQQSHADPGTAIKQLAAEALRQKGFLK